MTIGRTRIECPICGSGQVQQRSTSYDDLACDCGNCGHVWKIEAEDIEAGYYEPERCPECAIME